MSGKCPNCGQECASRFCPNCGTRQPDFDEGPQIPTGDSEEGAEQESEGAGSSSDGPHQDNPAMEEFAGDVPAEPEVGDDNPPIDDAAEAGEVSDSREEEDVVEPEDSGDNASPGDDAASKDDAAPGDDAAPQPQDEPLSDDGPSSIGDTQDVDETLISSSPEDTDSTVSSQGEDGSAVSDADDTPETTSSNQDEGPKLPDKTKRIAIGVAAAIALVLVVLFSTHVICIHEWAEASCIEPKTCTICGETSGEPLGHDWQDAACTEPKTCSRCNMTEGKSLGHEKVAATCTEPERCTRCGQTFGEPLGHDIKGQTCTADGTCSRCGEVFPAEGHKWVDATCTTPKTCSVCGQTEGEALGHTTANGVCGRCGLESYATQTGSGDNVVSDISTGDSIYRVHFTNSGSSNFAVWAYDSTGDRDLLVNTIGSYDGRVLLEGTSPYSFEVTSSGNWSYTVEPLGTTDATSFSGHGDFVTDIFPATTGSWRFTHDGSSNFAVWVYTTDGRDLPVNTIGTYDGTRMISVPAGSNAFFAITADGNWTITPA